MTAPSHPPTRAGEVVAKCLGVDLRSLDNETLEAVISDANAEQVKRARHERKRKRQRDAERHMDVRCPKCGAAERTRCLQGAKRIEVSHPERAWKTRGCPACDAGPGEWCKVGPVHVTRAHVARYAGGES